ncbi:MAG: GNAT family N-acetyltransferase [Candidatus Ornithomonoglobus sp.]
MLFYRCLHDEKYLAGITYYGAFDGKALIGEIGIRPKQRHICFFFVKGSYHRKGTNCQRHTLYTDEVPMIRCMMKIKKNY